MTCGCRIKVDHLNPENYFVAELLRCPLHEAAGEMLKALKSVTLQLNACLELMNEFAEADSSPHWIKENSTTRLINGGPVFDEANAAIAKAERKVTEKIKP